MYGNLEGTPEDESRVFLTAMTAIPALAMEHRRRSALQKERNSYGLIAPAPPTLFTTITNKTVKVVRAGRSHFKVLEAGSIDEECEFAL